MDNVQKVKLAVYETASKNLIDKDLSEEMLSFCESADLQNEDDVKMLSDITETLIAVAEAAEVSEVNEPVEVEGSTETPITEEVEPELTRDSIALEIFESEKTGQITADERDLLLSMLDGE